MERYSVRHPEILRIADGKTLHFGANQAWYPKLWQRMAGCGPTNAAHLAWYLSQTRDGCEGLVGYQAGTRAGFCRLMGEMWNYVTPGRHGVNRAGMFVRGMDRYAADRGFQAVFQVLEIEEEFRARPSVRDMSDFLADAMRNDRPVAFLNLHNGAENKLDRWHWVTLTGFNGDTFRADMYDQNRLGEIDLALWLRTTVLGGGMVAADVCVRQRERFENAVPESGGLP